MRSHHISVDSTGLTSHDTSTCDRRRRVLVFSNYKLFSQCLCSYLYYNDKIGVRNESSIESTTHAIEIWEPEVLLVDLSCGDTSLLSYVQQICGKYDTLKVIFLGVDQICAEDLQCTDFQASGYMASGTSLQELSEAIDQVVEGGVVCSPCLAYLAFARLASLSGEVKRTSRIEALKLTPREMETLLLIAEGLSNRRVADRLSLSIYTVKNHVHHILEKLQVSSREEAVQYAYERSWLPSRPNLPSVDGIAGRHRASN